MKISVNLDFDTENTKDIEVLSSLVASIKAVHEPKQAELSVFSYEGAWLKCSWEIITFALTVLTIKDGVSDKGTFAFFESLLDPVSTILCGALTERAISSRVGRTAVICKKMGDFRLMEVAIRRKDQAKRVYLSDSAKEALLNLLRGDWGVEFNEYLQKNGLEAPNLDDF